MLYESSPAFTKLPERFAISRSARAFSNFSLRSRAPANSSLSACHFAVNSVLRSCRSIKSFSKDDKRFLEAASSSNLKASTSICFCRISRSNASSSSGLLSTCILKRLAASSTKSIALSGKKRSVM